MRIGIDIDDTITETHDFIIKKICETYSLKKELIEHMNYSELKLNYPKVFSKENYNNTIINVKLKSNVKNVLRKISKNNEVYFITARNDNECDFPYNETIKYLIKKDIPFNNLEVNVTNKGEYALNNNIDLFIDDSIDNCNQVNSKGIEVILFDNKYNKNCNFNRIYNWNEIYKYIERK